DQLIGAAALDERQRLTPARGNIVAVLAAGELKLRLRVSKSHQIAVREVLPRGQPTREMHQRGPVHQRVVDIEERGRSQIGRRWARARPRGPWEFGVARDVGSEVGEG